MKRLIRHYFVPHEGNSFHPHAFRMEATLGFFALLLFIEIAFLSTAIVFRTNPGLLADILSGAVINATNVERTSQGIKPVTPNKLLETAAQRKAEAMAREGYFSHVSPDGKEPWAWLEEAGYQFNAAGENLAVNFFDSQDVARAWMNSVTHRANMLNRTYTEIGIGIAEGVYKGSNAIFVVQFFGTPLPTRSLVPAPPQPKPAITPRPPVPPVGRSPAPQPLAIEPSPPPLPQFPVNAGSVKSAEESTITITPFASLLTRALGSSHATTNYIFLILGTISLLIFTLALFVKMHVYHPRALVQGSLLLLFVAATFIVNYYVSLAHTAIL